MNLHWKPCMLACALAASVTATPLRATPYRQVVEFEHTADVGFGNEVCVFSTHPDLGGGDPALAPKMTWSEGNIWTLSAALPAGETITYRYLQRSNGTTQWCDPSTYLDLSSDQSLTVPNGPPAPWSGKTIIYYSGWQNVQLLINDMEDGDQQNWQVLDMVNTGQGRTALESEHRIVTNIPAGREVEFVFKNRDAEEYDNAFAPPIEDSALPPNDTSLGTNRFNSPLPYHQLSPPYNYQTNLDIFLVQDGQIYNYRPAHSVSPPRIVTQFIGSNVASIPGRTIRVYLPRGYDDHPNRHYPLLLMHDGQNCYFPGGNFGTWDADRIATYEIAQGRMRETIICAVDNTSNRITEYIPTGDGLYSDILIQGNAENYGLFLTQHVIPAMLYDYRVQYQGSQDNRQLAPQHAILAGSSLGGIVSEYLGQEIILDPQGQPLFGTLGIFSPAYWASPSMVDRRITRPKFSQKLFLYMGTDESSAGSSSSQTYWAGAFRAYDDFQRRAYPLNSELLFTWGCGAEHNEAAWAAQMPAFYHFALDPTQEANWLALELHPPILELEQLLPNPQRAHLRTTILRGIPYQLQESTNLQNWTDHSLPTLWTQPWDTLDIEQASPPTHNYFRLIAP